MTEEVLPISPSLCGAMVVSHIVGNHRAFAALTDAGRVICWGDAESGGDCSLTFPSNFATRCYLIYYERKFS